MLLSDALHVQPGVTAIIGGGGKTTLLLRLAQELSEKGRVLVCATAKMYAPAGMPLAGPDEARIQEALLAGNPACVGVRTPEGKLTLDTAHIGLLRSLAEYVLIEADGSRGLPLKAHAPHEPVIPAGTDRVLLVLGVDGLGARISEAAHRPELYAALLGVNTSHIVTPKDAARVIEKESLHDMAFINKVETAAQLALARELTQALHCPAAAGALRDGKGKICLLS